VFGVESVLSTVHFPLGQWIFHARFFFGGGGGVLCQSKEFPDMFMMGQSNWLAKEE